MPLAVRTLPLAVTGAAALLGLIAVLDPVYAVLGSLAVGFGLLMLTNVTAGLCLFAFSAALFEAIPEFGAFSVAKALGLALALSWIAAATVRPNLRGELWVEQPAYAFLLVALLVWGGLSILWAEDSSITPGDWIRLMLNVLLIPIAFSAIRSIAALRWVTLALLAGMLVSAAYGYLLTPDAIANGGRLGGAGLDPNYLALWLIIAATLGVGVISAPRQEPALRWATVGVVMICVLAALATASRTGLVALACVLLLAPLVGGRGRRGAAAILAVLAFGGVALYITAFAPDSVRQHVEESQDGGSGRTDIWKVGVRMGTNNPITGVGLGNFQTSSVHYLLEPGTITRSDYIVDSPKVAHNTYLQLFAELGGVGIALYLAVVLASVASGLAAARRFAVAGLRHESLFARAVVLATVAGMAGSFFITLEYTKPLWLLLALGPTTLHLARKATA